MSQNQNLPHNQYPHHQHHQNWGLGHQYGHPHQQGQYRPPAPPKSSSGCGNVIAVGCGGIIALFLIISVIGGVIGRKSTKKIPEPEEKKSHIMAREIADIFDGKCRNHDIDLTCKRFSCQDCKTSDGTVTHTRSIVTPAGQNILVSNPSFKKRDLDSGLGRTLDCGAYIIDKGPLAGYVVVEQMGQTHIATPQYFLPSVGSGFRADIKECVIAATLRK